VTEDYLPIPPGGEAFLPCGSCGRTIDARWRVCTLCGQPTGFEALLAPKRSWRGRRRDRRPEPSLEPPGYGWSPWWIAGTVALVVVLVATGFAIFRDGDGPEDNSAAGSGSDATFGSAAASTSETFIGAFLASADAEDFSQKAQDCIDTGLRGDENIAALDELDDDTAGMVGSLAAIETLADVPDEFRPAANAALTILSGCLGDDDVAALDSTANAYGEDPLLDQLWDRCGDSDLAACEMLYLMSAVGSEYEAYAQTCGSDADASEGQCFVDAGVSTDVAEFRRACEAGDGVGCDMVGLYGEVPGPDEDVAATCGGRVDAALTEDFWCVGLIGADG
jgi:hypothetical protein